ncbi:MAG TPA: CRISPR-associated protein Csx11, partial [Methylomirabilota bacterium]|nr:CRISPR-associated protein Csx11 [Methylomirabilota bacterium]
YIDLRKIQDERQDFYKFLEKKLRFLEGRHAELGEEEWLRIRQEFIRKIEHFFQMTVAETRRPLNDVTLFDQTLASVGFFKAALAQNLLLGWKEPYTQNVAEQYRWRLLRVGLDGLTFWRDSVRISDMLARKELVERVLDNVQVLLEVTCPLGFEVYRDENGSIFIVPDMQDLLGKTSIDGRQTLEEHIQAIAYKIFSGETLLSLDPSDKTRNMLSFGKLATKELPRPSPSVQWLKQEWQNEEKGFDVCPVCGLRSQGPTRKALNRQLCDECERRRVNRSKEWLQNHSTTIWIDEASDINGRLALLVGYFGIADWLSGYACNTILTFDPTSRQLTDPRRGDKEYYFDLSTL